MYLKISHIPNLMSNVEAREWRRDAEKEREREKGTYGYI